MATSFHFVLAAFILVLAAFHLDWIGGKVRQVHRRGRRNRSMVR
jgi:hypothetical protein